MSVVFDIATLQDIDDEVAALRAAIASINDRLARSEALENARRQLEHVESRIAQHEKAQRRREAEVEDLTARIEPEEQRLFSGAITNSKELVNIQHEVDTLKQKRSGLEDELLQIMERLDTLEARRASAREALTTVEQERAAEVEDLTGQLNRQQDDLAAAEQRRAAQVAAIPPAPLRTYEDLRKRKGGTVVARLQGSACGGCRVALPDAVRKQVLSRDAFVQCPHCGRILVPA